MWDERDKFKRKAQKAGMTPEQYANAVIAEHGTMYMAAKKLRIAVNTLRYWSTPLDQRREAAKAAKARRDARAAENAPTA